MNYFVILNMTIAIYYLIYGYVCFYFVHMPFK